MNLDLILSIFFSNAASKFDNLWTNLIENGYSDQIKITGFNQDFEIQQSGVKYQDLFFQSGFLATTAYFFKQNKQ